MCFTLFTHENHRVNFQRDFFQGTFSQCRSTPLENSRPLLRNYDFNHLLFLRLAFFRAPTLKDNHQGPADFQKWPASLALQRAGSGSVLLVGFFGCTENFEVPRNVHEESVHIDLIENSLLKVEKGNLLGLRMGRIQMD